ncbi:GTPase Era, mitochondrial [Melipona quadrifasciata]|uniref:GTPase Era, mitochondrial n=1 Tax=Melipona quadrifasciata TaxID=166423 RepID=A0A0M8ZPU5_9HYME|nr:GTPase Era, mitochondrial [Melipona quadrifasciata]
MSSQQRLTNVFSSSSIVHAFQINASHQNNSVVHYLSEKCLKCLEKNDQTELNDESDSCQKTKKLVKVAILGLPNAGKSTLVNKLIHRSVCPTSSKVHTTTHKAEAIYTENDTQIVFMDTPGLVVPKEMKTYKLSEAFKDDPKDAVTEADVIGIVQDVTNVYTRHKIDGYVLDYIRNKREDTELLMILNKVDRLKKKTALLEVTRILINKKDYPKFDDVFMVSALNGDGIDDLRNYLLDSAKVGNWKYDKKFYSNQSVETIMEQTVRAKLMDMLPYEMPYKIKIMTDHFDFGDDGSINALVTLNCPKEKYIKILLKGKIKCLAFYVEKELRHAFRTAVIVRINVQCIKSVLNQ